MKRDVLCFSSRLVLILLLALVLVAGCTRAKSSGPPEATEEAAAGTPVQPAGGEPTSTLSGAEVMNATASALAVTAEAETRTAAGTEVTETPTPTPTATATTKAPEETKAPEATEAPVLREATLHTVRPGENLFRIALAYGLTYQEVAAHNGIANPNIIYVGQQIKIPAAGDTKPQPPGGVRYHTVQPGENLFRISLRYNMLYTRLAAANGLRYPYIIYAGQRLVIP